MITSTSPNLSQYITQKVVVYSQQMRQIRVIKENCATIMLSKTISMIVTSFTNCDYEIYICH